MTEKVFFYSVRTDTGLNVALFKCIINKAMYSSIVCIIIYVG